MSRSQVVGRLARVASRDGMRLLAYRCRRKASLLSNGRRDRANPSYALALSVDGALERHFSAPAAHVVREARPELASVARAFLEHRFDLLGSGWVHVQHGMDCPGVGGHRYASQPRLLVDAKGHWLEGRINRANLAESQRMWRLLDPEYRPIDWQLDFKSGHRWSEQQWYADVRYGTGPGVDVKVPWELARMQHLPALALWAASERDTGMAGAALRAAEFELRNEVLDFVATNPPRWGVNWACTMDVAIRAANWVVAYDLLVACGASFDDAFESVFKRSLHEHGRHIVTNLEWDSYLRGNHYLANIAGLIFVAGYLPAAESTDAWLAFGLRELVAETELQFGADGANFEASTSYHRLSAEMVVYATALLLGLPESRRKRIALVGGSRSPAPYPRRRSAEHTAEPTTREGRIAFPDWYASRVLGMGAFTASLSDENGRVPQIGDNDDGRFLKLGARFVATSANSGTSGHAGITYREDPLHHGTLIAAIDALTGREGALDGAGRLESCLVRALSKGRTLAPKTAAATADARRHAGGDTELVVYRYPDFGLYCYRSDRLRLSIRCGSLGQNGRGGHAHNDQLAIELCIGGEAILVDPGTHVYTPLPEERNRFRSTAMHNTVLCAGREQHNWLPGARGLFMLHDTSERRVDVCSASQFVGRFRTDSIEHTRSLMLSPARISCTDSVTAPGERIVHFHLAPEVTVRRISSCRLEVDTGRARATIAAGGDLEVTSSAVSSGYGRVQETSCIRLRTTEPVITWEIGIG